MNINPTWPHRCLTQNYRVDQQSSRKSFESFNFKSSGFMLISKNNLINKKINKKYNNALSKVRQLSIKEKKSTLFDFE